MPQPTWTNTIQVGEYLGKHEYKCPRCCVKLSLEGNEVEFVSDFLLDQCPTCGTLIVIDQSDLFNIRVEGFSEPVDQMMRLTELTEDYSKRRKKGPSV